MSTKLHYIEITITSCQATMNFKNKETFIKEKYHLARKGATAFTQIVRLESVFKGNGECQPKLSLPKLSQIPLGTKRLLPS